MGADAAAQEQFGPYLVYERLGVGGMATVHRALERGIEGFERIVALKRLLPHLAADASFIKAFVREAKLASLLSHVNVVQIYELGRVGTQYFISMEYIDGRDIRRILRHARKASGPPPIHVTVGLLLQLCDALDYAHHKVDDEGHPLGLVHRDVSPSNVLVTSTGQVKVIDFGIAKAQSSQLRTQTGRVKGKLGYMAPEALAGKDLDARSDLFAVGVIAHELLTARPLFATKNEYQTLMKVQRGEVALPSAQNPQCPGELDQIVLRALARDPDERYASAGAMRDQLHALRRQYQLASEGRDVAAWLEWAFAQPTQRAATASAFEQGDASVELRAAPARSRPSAGDDDDAVDLAWGGVDDHNNGEPVVLDDVPDVSDKHLTSALGADVRIELDDLGDDIPTPAPSHGVQATPPLSSRTVTTKLRPNMQPGLSALQARARAASVPPATAPRAHSPSSAPRPRTSSVAPGVPIVVSAQGARGEASGALAAHASVPTPNAGVGVGVRSTIIPPRVRTVTIPPRLLPSGSTAPRTLPSLPPPAARANPAPSPARDAAIDLNPALGLEPALGAPTLDLTGDAPPRLDDDPPAIAVPTMDLAPRTRGGAALELASPAIGAPTLDLSQPAIGAPTLDLSPPAIGVPTLDLSPPAIGDPTLDFEPFETPTPPRGVPLRAPTATPIGPAPTASRSIELDVEDLGGDTMPSMPAARRDAEPAAMSAGPVVRFRAPTPPPDAARLAGPPAAAAAPRDDSAPRARPATRQPLITPATALFAEPEPAPEGHEVPAASAASAASAGLDAPAATAGPVGALPPSPEPARAARATRISTREGAAGPGATQRDAPRGRALAAVGALALVAAAAAAAWLVVSRQLAAAPEPPPSAATLPVRATAAVTFAITPADVEILIDGALAHVGAPWTTELAEGPHQIEVRRDGYKGLLTTITAERGKPTPVESSLEPLHTGERGAAPDAIPATAVSQLAGEQPRLRALGEPLPAEISIRLCIDELGHVTSYEVLTKVASRAAAEISSALRGWRYAPYRVGGAARAACFVVALAVR